jgi:hypothetical protein
MIEKTIAKLKESYQISPDDEEQLLGLYRALENANAQTEDFGVSGHREKSDIRREISQILAKCPPKSN